MKKLVGGGTMSIVNQTIPRALRRLGYTTEQIDEIVAYIDDAEDDPRRAAPRCRARAGVRLLDGRQHHPLRGSRADDGGGAAVPLGRDLQDGQHARGRHRRRRRARCTAVVGARPQGGRDLPRQLQGRPAAVDGEEGRRGRCGTPTSTAGDAEVVERIVERVVHQPVRQKLPRTPRGADVRVPGRRLQGLRHRRRVRRRPAGRDLPHGVEAGLDAGRDHGRVRQVDQLRPPVRRAAAGLRRGVHEHALRAGRHDRRSRHPLRQLDHGLPVPPPGARVPDLRRARRARHLLDRRAHCSRRCRASRRPSSRPARAPRSPSDPKSVPSAGELVDADAARSRSSPTPEDNTAGARHRPAADATPRCACSAACR